jgi:natural product precursor
MKLEKINLNELANAELDEREMYRLLGGGTSGCCQCGCNYSTSGGSNTSDNDSANNSSGYTSDPGATTPCDNTPEPVDPPQTSAQCGCSPVKQDNLCGGNGFIS